MNNTLSTLALLGLLATIPAASADANLGEAVAVTGDATALTATGTASCRVVDVNSDLVNARTPAATTAVDFETQHRLVAFYVICGNILIPGGCTLTYVFALVASTGPVVNYVWYTPIGAISVAGLVGAAGASGGQALGATLDYVACI